MEKLKKTIIGVPKTIYMALSLIFLLIDAIGFDLGSILAKIEIYNVAAAYNSLTAIFPPITQIAQDYKCVFLVLTLVTFGLWMYRPKLFLVRQISFSPDIAAVHPDILKKPRVQEIEINQCTAMKNTDTIVNAIIEQDKIAESIQIARKSSSLCYYGIGHTPLVFRLGFKMGDQNNLILLHKIRTNDSKFEEWTEEGGYSTITPRESNTSVISSELIISVSTSLKISDRDLDSLQPGNKHILAFDSNNISFDSITSYKCAESYRNAIMISIRDCVKKYGIQKIHLVISSSVAFTFFLGQAFSAQHDPITVVYHFQNGTYPWGICINEPTRKALVINDITESTA
ncbi:MAG: SAVED domain-containing protein [Desulfosporosinus sp.]|nr:SAVED domain-containing protein [Desulfosporosinus sp.]